MKKIGKVKKVFSAKPGTKSSQPRPEVDSLNLIEGHGIEFDKFAQKDLDKTVMILGKNSYEKALENEISLKEGSLGENIIFDFDPHIYEVGTILKVGESEIQITEKCTICNHLSVFAKKLPKVVKDCRGLYCKIIKDGIIKIDTEVYLKD